MEYEIYGLSEKGTSIICYKICSGSDVDKELNKLAKKYPGKKWLFGIDIRFRRDSGSKIEKGWQIALGLVNILIYVS